MLASSGRRALESIHCMKISTEVLVRTWEQEDELVLIKDVERLDGIAQHFVNIFLIRELVEETLAKSSPSTATCGGGSIR